MFAAETQATKTIESWLDLNLDSHPVSRFYWFFAAAKDSLVHSHEIVSTQPTGPASLVNFFREECNLQFFSCLENLFFKFCNPIT